MLLTLCRLSAAAGEIQGTVHRRLLEDREEELKVGAVLLLKQVTIHLAPCSARMETSSDSVT